VAQYDRVDAVNTPYPHGTGETTMYNTQSQIGLSVPGSSSHPSRSPLAALPFDVQAQLQHLERRFIQTNLDTNDKEILDKREYTELFSDLTTYSTY
jgi:hypothetical protein